MIFIDEEKVDFERGVGIFLKRSLGLADSFPHAVAQAMLGVKHVKTVQFEQRAKFLIRLRKNERFPVFEAVAVDRIDLFPKGIGLNAKLGEMLNSVGLLRTMDFCECFREIGTVMRERSEAEHRGRLLASEGRAFWTEMSPNGYMCSGLKQVLSRLSFDALRIVVMLFADVLCWTALKQPDRTCPSCHEKFTSAHFFSCSKCFQSSSAWAKFVELCRTESWEDVVDCSFAVLQKWVAETNLFRDSFRLHVLEYECLGTDEYHVAFRWLF